MKASATIALAITLTASFAIDIAMRGTSNVIDYLTHQGLLQLILGVLLIFTIFIPYLKRIQAGKSSANAVRFAMLSSALATVAAILIVALLTIFLSAAIKQTGISFVDTLEILGQLAPQIVQPGTLFLYVQWLLFASIFYCLAQKASNKAKQAGTP